MLQAAGLQSTTIFSNALGAGEQFLLHGAAGLHGCRARARVTGCLPFHRFTVLALRLFY